MGGFIYGRKWNALQGAFFVFLTLAAAYILLKSSVFEVKNITVRGLYALEEGTVRAAAGIGTGKNIFQIDLKSAAQNLKTLPQVKEVHLFRHLPSTVVIEVTERVPRALLAVEGGFVTVDDEGFCLGEGRAGTVGLPVLTGVNVAGLPPDELPGSQVLKQVLQVVCGLPPDVLENISEVHVNQDGQFVLYTLEGIPCRFGAPSEVKEKGILLKGLLAEVDKESFYVKYIDLVCAEQPVVYYYRRN